MSRGAALGRAWRAVRRGPVLLACGVGLGLAWPWLAEQARPAMPLAIFLLILGTLLRMEVGEVRAVLRQRLAVVVLPLLCMVVSPAVAFGLGRAVGLPDAILLALVLGVSAPPSSGNTAVAGMLGLDGGLALVVTTVGLVVAPVSVPLVAAWAGGVAIDPVGMAERLAVVVGVAGGVTWWARRYAAVTLARSGALVDLVVLGALLVFAVATMAGLQARVLAEPGVVLGFVALAFAANLVPLGLGMLVPGTLVRRATSGLVLGNRNVGLVWAMLGSSVSPTMALYFAAAQLPIYLVPGLLQGVLRAGRAESRRGG